MKDQRIMKLHRIAEFQKKLAWANYEAAKKSKLFKQELLPAQNKPLITAGRHARR